MAIFTEHPGRHVADIELFALSTCPYCRATKEFLNEHDIEYKYVDVDTAPPGALDEIEYDIEKFNPQETFPTVVINGGEQVIVGFQQDALEKLIAA